MTFNSLAFLVFAPLFFLVYGALGRRARMVWLLVASYVFYGWWNWRFVGLLLFSTSVDYGLGRLLAATDDARRRRILVGVSVAVNLSLLGTFKYFNFFADSAVRVLHALGMAADPVTLRVALPIGISFYTFQSLSYVIDVYRGRLKAERDFLLFASFVAMFPQLVAGPIVRATRLLPQLRAGRELRWVNVLRGLELVAYGFFLKIGVADNLGGLVGGMLHLPLVQNAASLLVAIVLFAFQIYGDFAGYSLIAIGLGRMLGYDFGRNFNRPYLSASFSEFWTRWHISLSGWFRDYLYIPLGGNRGGALATGRNLMITMLLGGLWHGANWTFVAWGALHGCYLVLQRLVATPWRATVTLLRLPAPLARGCAILAVFGLTLVAWIFFRAPDLADAMAVLDGLVRRRDYDFAGIYNKVELLRGLVGVALLVAVELIFARPAPRRWFRRRRWARQVAVLAIGWYLVAMGNFSGEQFIYFQF